MENLQKRKKLRLEGYDYSASGAYFITICTKDKKQLFGKIVGDAPLSVPRIHFSEIGKTVKMCVENTNNVYRFISVDKYVIMPNHIHMILVIVGGTHGGASPTKSLIAKAVNALKSLTSRQIGFSLWQRSYHDHIIRNQEEYKMIWEYIDGNLAKWKEDRYYL